MDINDIRKKYLDFFVNRGHVVVPSTSLVPEGDATTLFTSAGMQPMMPYLLGEKHPLGTRLVDSQKCFRSQDIEEVGDNRHTTFFEMLGNWSLGDYFKKDQLEWFYTFLTDKNEGLSLDPSRLYVSVFAGGSGVDKDTEAITLWQELFSRNGIEAKEGERIFPYPANKNWWSRSGTPEQMPSGEPGGPDSEVFYDFGTDFKFHENSKWKDEPCHPNCDCGRFIEIGNSVFMQYLKQDDGSLKELPAKNIDFGGGLVRLSAATLMDPDVFKTSILSPIISKLELITDKKYSEENNRPAMRVLADHLTAATFLIKDGVIPGNKTQGYVLRRLLRRAAVKFYYLTGSRSGLDRLSDLIDVIIGIYTGVYFEPEEDTRFIKDTVNTEIGKFSQSLEKGLRELEKNPDIDGKGAFDLYQNLGFPLEITVEILSQMGRTINIDQFKEEFEKHRDLSRSTSAGMFKGGLADKSETVTAYHTATHLLHTSLRQILGTHVQQKGSNITSERLRFDFSHPEKLTDEQIAAVQDLINQKISEKLSVTREEKPREEALSEGALAFFGQKYPDIVSVYTIGSPPNFFSKEFCGGPHVTNTGELAKIKIVKQESLGASLRRLYLQFE
ncbi:MAG: alanyl-tRNA synthetase [Candidatus Collierbacteria bacterium GW2011_GWF2_44_15]|uniref:alanine--tRNA ligase n=5 Tax=Candidatus Collieribacteriota TaxID=1752725 RepID=A0A0G1HGV8_9BACT|nr:MAG: alanyl-tRNA synthetase [Candidatus Collierbacteria bacterium GW2011_GWA1_44_12]KKT39464.1 MAG: alanyl-tRNA synthetase [Candidatus Collierbacteria bacterium GW2011_GWF1_44_12]KKT46105.1 MAG: alanyl-tRNA synthetase [Candidatus Collierbacteria bacterium GW2011_GWF2_44_15]